jgi:hypothetical protein
MDFPTAEALPSRRAKRAPPSQIPINTAEACISIDKSARHIVSHDLQYDLRDNGYNWQGFSLSASLDRAASDFFDLMFQHLNI